FKKSNLSSGQVKFAEEVEKLKSYSNTFLLGPKPSSFIPSFLQKMDMLIMLYDTEGKIAEIANPHKMLEYLSSGKKNLTNFIYEYRNRRDLVEMVEDPSTYISKFKEVLYRNEAPEK